MVENSAKTMLKFVIEHLELHLGKWLLIEYRHASEIVGRNRLIFANVQRKTDSAKLSKLGNVSAESVTVLFRQEDLVVLDPKAEKPLKPMDFLGKRAVVIGGILGDHPPKGRTFSLLTSRVPMAVARNIGGMQFSIDAAVYVAKLVSEGTPLEKIPVKKGLTLKLSENHYVRLPYAYPLKNGKPVISQELIAHLRSEKIVKDERRAPKSQSISLL